MPRVSVIIPTYNRARLAAEAIRSVQAQTFADLEILVVDDASRDDTPDVLRQLAAGDDRIRLFFQQRNQGAQVARNLALAQAQGELIAFLDSDDQFGPDQIAQQVALFDQFTDLDAVIVQSQMFRETPGDSDYVWNHLDAALTDSRQVLPRVLRTEISWGINAPLWRRAFLDQVGPFNENLLCTQEREYHVRALCHAPRLRFVETPLTYVRVHDDPSMSKTSFNAPPQMRSRLRSARLSWEALIAHGLTTAENRAALTAEAVKLARLSARHRYPRAALRSWLFALRIAPDMATRIKLVAALLPAIVLVLATRRGFVKIQALTQRLGLESTPDRTGTRYVMFRQPH